MRKLTMLITLTCCILVSVNFSYAGEPAGKTITAKPQKERIIQWCGVSGTLREITYDDGHKIWACVAGLATICFYLPCDVFVPYGKPAGMAPVAIPPNVNIEAGQQFWAKYDESGVMQIHYVNSMELDLSPDGTESTLIVN